MNSDTFILKLILMDAVLHLPTMTISLELISWKLLNKTKLQAIMNIIQAKQDLQVLQSAFVADPSKLHRWKGVEILTEVSYL